MYRKSSRELEHWTTFKYLAYGVGHVFNDMCASTWFSYLLIFLREVIHLSPVDSAVVMFCGQITDGIATPLVGIFSDNSKGFPNLGFGRRKTWLAGGALIVLVCFYLVFADCALGWFWGEPTRLAVVIYYSTFASLFNAGWASVQVSHMAMVPELSSSDSVRCLLNSTRYAFTILSNVLVFVVFFILLRDVAPYKIPDNEKFRLLADVCIGVGGFCCMVFLIGTKEKLVLSPIALEKSKEDIIVSPSIADGIVRGPMSISFDSDMEIYHPNEVYAGSSRTIMTWKSWFRCKTFYQVGFAYMCTRLVVNVTQVFISFFLLVTLHMSATSIAIAPLLVYISGFLATFFLRFLNDRLGRSGSFSLGAFLVVISLICSYILEPQYAHWIYGCSMVLGVGNAIMMVTSVCLEGDVVGSNIESGAFVYGAMSFTDKVSNGVAILLIQNVRQHLQTDPAADAEFLRWAFCVLPSVAAIAGSIIVAIMQYEIKNNREIHTPSPEVLEPMLVSNIKNHEKTKLYGSRYPS